LVIPILIFAGYIFAPAADVAHAGASGCLPTT